MIWHDMSDTSWVCRTYRPAPSVATQIKDGVCSSLCRKRLRRPHADHGKNISRHSDNPSPITLSISVSLCSLGTSNIYTFNLQLWAVMSYEQRHGPATPSVGVFRVVSRDRDVDDEIN